MNAGFLTEHFYRVVHSCTLVKDLLWPLSKFANTKKVQIRHNRGRVAPDIHAWFLASRQCQHHKHLRELTGEADWAGGGSCEDLPDDFGAGSRPPAALKHPLHCGFCPIVHLTGHCSGNSVLTPVPKTQNKCSFILIHKSCLIKGKMWRNNELKHILKWLQHSRRRIRVSFWNLQWKGAISSLHMCSPELGRTGSGTWWSCVAALLRFDALPLHSDAREAINKPCSQRRTH